MFPRNQYADSRPLFKTLSGMTWKEKMDYLWTYYHWVLLVLVLVAMIISIVVSSIRNSRTEILVGGYLINTSISQEGEQYLTEDLLHSLDGQKNQTVELASAFLGDSNSSMPTAYMQIIAMIAAQELDYVIMDASGLDLYLSQNAFSPLTSVLTESQLTQWADELVWHSYGTKSEEEYAMAIDISKTPFAQDCLKSSDSVYIAFPGNRENAQSASEILEYLINWGNQ